MRKLLYLTSLFMYGLVLKAQVVVMPAMGGIQYRDNGDYFNTSSITAAVNAGEQYSVKFTLTRSFNVSQYGVIYTSSTPGAANGKTTVNTSGVVSDLTAPVFGLTPGATYSVRPYIISNNYTYYGDTFACVLFATVEYTETFTVPASVTQITMLANGAKGGVGYSRVQGGVWLSGGRGASMRGTLNVTPGDKFTVLVGGGGGDGSSYYVTGASGGGGGGSFITRQGYLPPGYNPTLVAGGGGGAGACGSCSAYQDSPGGPGTTGINALSVTSYYNGTWTTPGGQNGNGGNGNCGGGGGWLANGSNTVSYPACNGQKYPGNKATVGAMFGGSGGYGGGGAAYGSGGGGGGYSGGSGDSYNKLSIGASGGGSFIDASMTNQETLNGANPNINGVVVMAWTPPAS